VRRRPFLTLATAAVLSPVAGQQPAHAATTSPLPDLQDLLLHGPGRIPPPRHEPTHESVAASLLTSRQEFKAAHYDTLAAALPHRIAAAQLLRTPDERAATSPSSTTSPPASASRSATTTC
jgi:hypothetical protein